MTILGVGAVAAGVSVLRPDPYTAESVLVVPSSQDGPASASADEANRLAVTYAKLIPEDDRVLDRVGDELDLSATSVARRLSIEVDEGTSLLRLSFRDDRRSTAVTGAREVAKAIAGDHPASPAIPSRSMAVVRVPDRAKQAPSAVPGVEGAYTADAVLVLPTKGRPGVQAGPDQANKVANNYARVIPEDSRLLAHVAARLDMSLAEVRRSISVVNDGETSLVRIRFQDSPDAAALEGSRVLAEAVSGQTPLSSTIAPGSLNLLRLPDMRPGRPNRTIDALPLGLLLGLGLGVVLLIAWERADPRIDDVSALSVEADSPSSSLFDLSTGSIAAMLDRWQEMAGASPAKVAVLPATPRLELTAAIVVQQLLAAGRTERRNVTDADVPEVTVQQRQAVAVGAEGESPSDRVPARRFGTPRGDTAMRLVSGGAPGSDAAGEALALGADLVVLVASKGTRVAEVRSARAVLAEFNGSPGWALLAPPAGGLLARRRRRAWLREHGTA